MEFFASCRFQPVWKIILGIFPMLHARNIYLYMSYMYHQYKPNAVVQLIYWILYHVQEMFHTFLCPLWLKTPYKLSFTEDVFQLLTSLRLPRNHHLGNMFYFFETTLSKSKLPKVQLLEDYLIYHPGNCPIFCPNRPNWTVDESPRSCFRSQANLTRTNPTNKTAPPSKKTRMTSASG